MPRSTDVSYASRIFIRCFCYHDLLTTLCSIQSHTSPTCMHIASKGELFVMIAWIRGGLHTSPDGPCGFSVSLAASQPTRCHNPTCRSVSRIEYSILSIDHIDTTMLQTRVQWRQPYGVSETYEALLSAINREVAKTAIPGISGAHPAIMYPQSLPLHPHYAPCGHPFSAPR